MVPRQEKTCLRGFANNKCADQLAHPRSLISIIVIRLLKRIISRLATGEISIIYLVYVAEQAGLNLNFSKTLKSGFLALRSILTPFATAIDLISPSLSLCQTHRF